MQQNIECNFHHFVKNLNKVILGYYKIYIDVEKLYVFIIKHKNPLLFIFTMIE